MGTPSPKGSTPLLHLSPVQGRVLKGRVGMEEHGLKQLPLPSLTIPRLLRDLSPRVLNSFFLLGMLEVSCKQLHPSPPKCCL